MSNSNSSFSWKDGLMILLAVLTFGISWFANNQTAVIAYASVLVVWLLAMLGKWFPQLAWIKGKTFLTVLVFVASFGLGLLFKPLALPAFPTWTGDIAAFVTLLATWLSAFFAGIQGAVAEAIAVYNIMLAQVLDKTTTTVLALFLPKSKAAVSARVSKR